jgi:hypothetical protein
VRGARGRRISFTEREWTDPASGITFAERSLPHDVWMQLMASDDDPATLPPAATFWIVSIPQEGGGVHTMRFGHLVPAVAAANEM